MDRRSFIGNAGAASAAVWVSGFFPAAAGAAWSETREERDRRLAWWREARFGMFIHWGIYSIPAGVWEGKRVKSFPAEWIRFARNIPAREYEPLAARFNPVKFDAAAFAGLARDAGMKYMVITSKHHDGFCMFDSKHTQFDIMDATPFKRDPLAELSRACADAGVRFGFYYSELDWHWSLDARSGIIVKFKEYLDYMKAQLKELFTNYGPIGSVFFDGQWMPQWNDRIGRDMLEHCRGLSPATIFNDRLGKQAFTTLPGSRRAIANRVGDYSTPEQYVPKKQLGDDWETCMTTNDSWGYRSWDENWKPADSLIRDLVDIAGKGGNFLLNVGPTSEGLAPGPCAERLLAMGDWLKLNGEAVYGTEAGPIQDAAWGRTTQKAGRVFLHVFDWPRGELIVEGLEKPVARAYLLADPGKSPLPVKSAGDQAIIKLPEKPLHPAATVIVIEESGER
jgi:alpha-L-fucosidase